MYIVQLYWSKLRSFDHLSQLRMWDGKERSRGMYQIYYISDKKNDFLRFLLQLDSLKPKENLVIRQRYGLDGKGDRTLGEIAGNLNISREMVRKHEMKALMKLKHPARMDYLRHHIH